MTLALFNDNCGEIMNAESVKVRTEEESTDVVVELADFGKTIEATHKLSWAACRNSSSRQLRSARTIS